MCPTLPSLRALAVLALKDSAPAGSKQAAAGLVPGRPDEGVSARPLGLRVHCEIALKRLAESRALI